MTRRQRLTVSVTCPDCGPVMLAASLLAVVADLAEIGGRA